MEAKVPDSCPQQITTFLEQWKKLRAAVIEMGPYAKMISQVEDVLEEDTEIKTKLKRSEEKIERLNHVIDEMIVKFQQQHLALQEKHDSSLHEMNILVQDTKKQLRIRCGELEKSVQNCRELENQLRAHNGSLSAITEKYQELWRALGFIEVDDFL
jgi:DNA repair ATPase RecN